MILSPLAGLFGDLWLLTCTYRSGFPGKSGRAEVAVVLGAQVLRGGRPSTTLRARTEHAGRLYAEGRVSLLIPTGGVGEHPPSEADIMYELLRSLGVPDEAILREDRALNTWDSAQLVAELARRRGIQETRLVTDPLHCVRAVAAFREAGLNAVAEPVYSSPMWRRSWFRRGQFMREAAAIVWYRVWHRVGSRFPR